MSQPKVSVAVKERAVLGEGPHWDAQKQCLYYVDILSAKFFKFIPSSNKLTECSLPSGSVSLIVPVEGTDDQFIVSWGRKLLKITWDGVSGEPSATEDLIEIESEPKYAGNRINDGKCDPTGRLFAGTMGPEDAGNFTLNAGSFHNFNLKTKSSKKFLDGISISNGLAWSADLTKFYYIDSLTYSVDEFDYDSKTGDISNRKSIFNLRENKIEGIPDGMCIDAEGMLWIALFNGASVIRVDPKTRKLLQQIPIPAKQITSVAFGGPNLDILYVVCASVLSERQDPNAGCLYQITGLGVKGLPGVSVKLS